MEPRKYLLEYLTKFKSAMTQNAYDVQYLVD